MQLILARIIPLIFRYLHRIAFAAVRSSKLELWTAESEALREALLELEILRKQFVCISNS